MMSGIPISSEVLGAMITPAVLISASGVLVLSTSNRVGRTVDRVRALAVEAECLQSSPESTSTRGPKRKLLANQLSQLSERAVLLRSAMTALYTAIGLLVGTSILVGIVALLQWRYSSLPVVVGFAGACALLYGSLLLVREARFALRSTLQEVAFAREAFIEKGEQRLEAEAAWNWFRRAWRNLRCSGDSRFTRWDKTRRKNDSLFYTTQVGTEFADTGLEKDRRKKMKIKIAVLASVLLVGSLVATGAAMASEDVFSEAVEADIQPSGESLRRLATALSGGRGAMRSFRGSQSQNSDNKERLNPPIAGIECHADRIASYVSCYSSPAGAEEVEALFTSLVDELQAALPSDRWKGMNQEPGLASIQSRTYVDQASNAHIDIDIIARVGIGGQSSYIVSIFGWPH